MVLGWFKCITFIVHFISIIITSASPQNIRHYIPEFGDPLDLPSFVYSPIHIFTPSTPLMFICLDFCVKFPILVINVVPLFSWLNPDCHRSSWVYWISIGLKRYLNALMSLIGGECLVSFIFSPTLSLLPSSVGLEVSQIGFLKKQTLRLSLMWKMSIKAFPWDKCLWKGDNGSRSEERTSHLQCSPRGGVSSSIKRSGEYRTLHFVPVWAKMARTLIFWHCSTMGYSPLHELGQGSSFGVTCSLKGLLAEGWCNSTPRK